MSKTSVQTVQTEISALREALVSKAISVKGEITAVTNGRTKDGSANRLFAAVTNGSESTDEIVRLDVTSNGKVYKNIRTNAQVLANACKRANVQRVIGATFYGKIIELHVGEKAIGNDKAGKQAIITIGYDENGELMPTAQDRNQLSGEYFLSASLNDSIASVLADKLASAMSI